MTNKNYCYAIVHNDTLCAKTYTRVEARAQAYAVNKTVVPESGDSVYIYRLDMDTREVAVIYHWVAEFNRIGVCHISCAKPSRMLSHMDATLIVKLFFKEERFQ